MSDDDLVFPLAVCPEGHEIIPVFTVSDQGDVLMACPEHEILLGDTIIDLLTAEEVQQRGYVILVS